MPEKENTLEAIDPEILSALNSCKEPYLKRIILQIINYNPEIKDSVKELIAKISNNQKNDNINKLVVSANFPRYLSTIVFQTSIQPAFLKKTRKSMKGFPNLAFFTAKTSQTCCCMVYQTLGERK